MIIYYGFTLIEVLISLLLLSFILSGFDAMELYSLNSLRNTYNFHLATQQLISMTERLRSMGPYPYQNEEAIWNEQNKQLLPRGVGTVAGQYPDYTVTLYWGDMTPPCPNIMLGQSGCVELRVTL
jgi:prepilin-type N-terminal cleavage/methylation domain-containing protein